MKSFSAWLLELWWRVSRRRLEKALTGFDRRAVEEGMHRWIERMSDKDIDRAIRDIKEGNYYGLDISAFERVGLGVDVVLQWLENEKFLRDRKKYHPRS